MVESLYVGAGINWGVYIEIGSALVDLDASLVALVAGTWLGKIIFQLLWKVEPSLDIIFVI